MEMVDGIIFWGPYDDDEDDIGWWEKGGRSLARSTLIRWSGRLVPPHLGGDARGRAARP